MNIIIAETDIDKAVNKFIRKFKEKSTKNVNSISNPMKSYCHSFRRNDRQYNIIGVDIKALPIYYILFIVLFLLALYPNMFFAILSIILCILSVPFTTPFWKILYLLGIRKNGYKGKVRFLRKDKALEVLLWDK